jgi:hypothetical protein
MALGGKEASHLATAASIARLYFIARIAQAAIAATSRAESAEQFAKAKTRQVKQTTAGTARVAANIVTGTANIVTGTAIADHIARTTVASATAIQTKSTEESAEREPGRATISGTARVTIADNITRTAIADHIARAACLRGKQTTQTSAQTYFGCAANIVARIAGDFIARIASNNGIARIATVDSNTVDQSFKTGEQVSSRVIVAGTARVNAGHITRIRKTLYTHQKGDHEGSHQNSDFHWVISPFRFAGLSEEKP